MPLKCISHGRPRRTCSELFKVGKFILGPDLENIFCGPPPLCH
jgi:hypothetical protein